MYQDLLQVDFTALEKKFQQTETRVLLDLTSDDEEVIDCIFEQDYIGLNIPLIPATNKTSQGVVMLKSLGSTADQEQNRQSASSDNGIYLRNDRRGQSATTTTASKSEQEKGSTMASNGGHDEKELDDLLGLGSVVKKDTQAQDINIEKHTMASTRSVPKPGMAKLKVPGSASSRKANEKEKPADDQAWLDDLLG
ncbi:unnamed protein product [Absidia cylindrospora]